MILTVLGSSGSAPGPGNPCSGYLVERDGHRLLLDLGTGAFGPLLAHARPDQVDTVVISHRHADHAADLAVLAYAQERLGRRGEPTRVVAPAGTASRVGRSTLLAFRDAEPGELECGPFRLRLARVRHSVEAYAVRVEDDCGSLTYTGDSGPCRELVGLACGSGVLLAEAALGPGTGPEDGPGRWEAGRDAPGPHHLTVRQAGALAAAAGVGLLAVTHVRPWDTPDPTPAAAHFAGPVLLAVPGLRLFPGTAGRTAHPEVEPFPEGKT